MLTQRKPFTARAMLMMESLFKLREKLVGELRLVPKLDPKLNHQSLQRINVVG
ncbi:MAG: hypothetical protein ACI8W7_004977 [Gammaproteobacteria bacterium]|jgi:hypothetical protein